MSEIFDDAVTQTPFATATPAPLPVKKKKRFRNKQGKLKKRYIFLLVVVILTLLIGFSVFNAQRQLANLPLISLADTTQLQLADIEDSVSATGVVESASSTTVYSTLAYTVQEVNVEVGDYVEAGTLLAKLDANNIQKQIESQQASLGVSAKSSAQQIKSAEDNYIAAKSALESGINGTIISAQSQVDTTYNAYVQAQDAYNRYRQSLDVGENSTLLMQEAALLNAENAVDTAEDAYDAAIDERDAAGEKMSDKEDELTQAQNAGADSTVLAGLEKELDALAAAYDAAAEKARAAKKAVSVAADNYDNTKAQYNATVTSVDNTLADYATNVDTAYRNWQTALVSLDSARASVNDQLQSSLNSLNSVKASGNDAVTQVSLRQLRADLADTKITAPVSGTVTAVYAEVGGSGSGLLFVIEDVNQLVVETSVKGYDVGTVKTGMPVTIKADATGDQVFQGTISSIAPTATKNSQGTTDTTKETLFATEVQVLSMDTGLRIGMSVRLNYLIDQEKNALAVPYDAVYQNQQGQACVMTATLQESGKYLLEELPVQTGMENDLNIVISGSGVNEGLRVVNEPAELLYLLGTEINISEKPIASASSANMMMGGF